MSARLTPPASDADRIRRAGSIAASYTLVLHAALWLPITLLGFYYLWRQGLSWRDFRRAEELPRSEIRRAGLPAREQEVIA